MCIIFPTHSEYTLTIENILKCLKENVRVDKWKTLYDDLKIPPPHIPSGEHPLLALKVWILTDSNATWQKLAMSLYTSALDGALKDVKSQYLLSTKGM